MANATPVKAIYASDNAVALGEFTDEDTIPVELLDPATLRTHIGLATLAGLNAIVTDATLVDVAGDNTWTGQQTFSGGAKEVWSALTGTTPAIGQGNYTWTLSGNSTPTSALTDGESTTIHIAGTTSTIDWSSTVDQWIGGSEPALPETGEAVIVLWKHGGTVTGTHLGNAS